MAQVSRALPGPGLSSTRLLPCPGAVTCSSCCLPAVPKYAQPAPPRERRASCSTNPLPTHLVPTQLLSRAPDLAHSIPHPTRAPSQPCPLRLGLDVRSLAGSSWPSLHSPAGPLGVPQRQPQAPHSPGGREPAGLRTRALEPCLQALAEGSALLVRPGAPVAGLGPACCSGIIQLWPLV